jgi:hypothetical protein
MSFIVICNFELIHLTQNKQMVIGGTDDAEVDGGKLVTIDATGACKSVVDSDIESPSFAVQNSWKTGASIIVSTFDDTKGAFTPAFVSPRVVKDSFNTISPLMKVGLFVSMGYSSQMYILDSRTKIWPIDFGKETTAEVEYDGDRWTHL